ECERERSYVHQSGQNRLNRSQQGFRRRKDADRNREGDRHTGQTRGRCRRVRQAITELKGILECSSLTPVRFERRNPAWLRKFHFHLAVLSVSGLILGVVGDNVLIAQFDRNPGCNARQISISSAGGSRRTKPTPSPNVT